MWASLGPLLTYHSLPFSPKGFTVISMQTILTPTQDPPPIQFLIQYIINSESKISSKYLQLIGLKSKKPVLGQSLEYDPDTGKALFTCETSKQVVCFKIQWSHRHRKLPLDILV